MTSDEQIRELLVSCGIELAGPIVRDDGDEIRVYAFIQASQDSENKRTPSNYTLRKISELLIAQGIYLLFVITSEGSGNIEETTKLALFMSFPDLVRNVFVSSPNGRALIWIEPKRLLSETDETSIRKKCIDLLKVLDHPLDAVRFTSTENIPTRTACLKSIRLHAPISKDELSDVLRDGGFYIPGGEWLPRMLDGLRKAGLVTRRQDGGFVLTYTALLNLGSAKGSRSPDIGRALDLARRAH